ncbi:MAG TPA: hypothetical protein VE820_05690 [Sphingomicrobium sp.]|nr:hypothetical protein [Sphingomicrobium sp.]
MNAILDSATTRLPLWAVGLILVALFIGACAVGQLGGRRRDLSGTGKKKAERASEGYIVTAIFALLGFMLATTFSMALSRFDTRRLVLATEVDAIGTAYMRASLLDEPHATIIRGTLRKYAHCRIASQNWSAEQFEDQVRVCQKVGKELWSQTRDAVEPYRTTALASYTIAATNDVLNAAVRREIAGRAVIPARVITVLLICTIAAAMALGWVQAGRKVRLGGSTALLLTLYAVCFVLILDIDRSRTGSVAVSQKPMQALASELDHDAP